MKKRYWIAGLSCLAGIILLGISFIMIKGDFTKLNSKNVGSYVKREFECTTDISEIYVKDFSGSIQVKSADVSRPVVEYYENNLHEYTVTEENGVLNVMKNREDAVVFFVIDFNIDFNRYDVCVTVPRDYDGTLKIQNTSGSVNVSDVECKALSIRNTSGSISLSNVSVDGDVEVNGTSGRIKIETLSSNHCMVSNTSGSITLNGITANGNVTTSNTSGSVRFDRLCATGDIRITNKSGSIRGSIVGDKDDYSITANTISGSCNLKDSTSGSKQLFVESHSGSVNIQFE